LDPFLKRSTRLFGSINMDLDRSVKIWCIISASFFRSIFEKWKRFLSRSSIYDCICLHEIMVILHLGYLCSIFRKVEQINIVFWVSSKIYCLQLHHYTVDPDGLIQIW